MFEGFVRRYGRYMGGIDYEKVLNQLRNEDEELRIREELILGARLGGDHGVSKMVRDIERRQLLLKYAMLKREESEVLGLIEELKLRGYTEPEIRKARARLRKVRRELRLVRRLLREF
ncbi:hypothetical protein [Vulcanisaeta thermophila]|uniref:hypothetical protein n=1 Tax=Vulcanisaeta thermophila TaxID=867917 RepID=UPI000853352D|nr:hypothetical protein [Vulcanisaeta thermophila]